MTAKRPIAAASFYGAPKSATADGTGWSLRLKRLRLAASRETAAPLPPAPLPEDLRRGRQVWKHFFTQASAFEFAQSCWVPPSPTPPRPLGRLTACQGPGARLRL